LESLQPLRFYLFRDGLGRLCSQRYVPPTSRNISQVFMHLTNYSLNKVILHHSFISPPSSLFNVAAIDPQFNKDFKPAQEDHHSATTAPAANAASTPPTTSIPNNISNEQSLSDGAPSLPSLESSSTTTSPTPTPTLPSSSAPTPTIDVPDDVKSKLGDDSHKRYIYLFASFHLMEMWIAYNRSIRTVLAQLKTQGESHIMLLYH
jgi:hypothetical protein